MAGDGSRAEIATVGDNCIDRYLALGFSTVGGNAVNVAVQLARQGRATAYFGAVGRDAAGARTLAALRSRGVETAVRETDAPTAVTDIDVDAAGERFIAFEDFGACLGYRPDEAEVARLLGMCHVHLGWLDDGGALKRRLSAAGIPVSQDLSVNAAQDSAGAADLAVAFGSAGSSHARARAMAAEALAAGARLAVVTMGSLGSLATDGTLHAETGVRTVSATDTTGAGDTFIAAFLHARLEGRPLGACLEAGRDAAAETCTHPGGFPQAPEPLSPTGRRT